MRYHYAILGAGRQGTAAAYDLARFGDAAKITLADMSLETAQKAAARVNSLAGRDVAVGIQLNVADLQALEQALTGVDCALSAVPYYFNLDITKTAIKTGTHLCDMGGNTDVVFAQLALDAEAKARGISIVPDCGMGPGLINTIGAYVIEQFDEPLEVLIYDGGLPQTPRPPWNYEMLFHINGLTNEYYGTTAFLENYEIAYVEGMTGHELIEIPPFGKLEAFITTGGTSTAPWTWQGKVKTYRNKTLRYPGHFAWFEGFKTLGLFEETPIEVNGQQIIPRQVYHALLAPRIASPEPRDVCVMRIIGTGVKNGKHGRVTVDLVDYYDEATGFLAMERLTGWHCAIMMAFQTSGVVVPGGVPMETAVPPALFMAELPRRGIHFTVRFEND